MLPPLLLVVVAVAHPSLAAVAYPSLALSQWTGSPGQPWAEQEILNVKAKLLQVFHQTARVYDEYLTLHPDVPKPTTHEDYPNAPKMLRLGFHDCLRTEGGGGGCNGCLNPTGMGVKHQHGHWHDQSKVPDVTVSDNNGLGMTADVLEEIYTNADFPKDTPHLEVSLAASGKSRADLWAFSTLVAAEWGIEQNNLGCLSGGHVQAGTERCFLTPSSLPVFTTGRRDCQPSDQLDRAWKTTEVEVQPSVVGNGTQTADFFKANFGLTGRQGAALLVGAHSFGKFNVANSMFKYSWTRHQETFLNNQLFRHLAMAPQYKGDCGQHGPGDGTCYLTGDYLGQPAETRWLVRGNKLTATGGPFQWGHWYMRCPSSNECARITADQAVQGRNSSTAYPGVPQPPGPTGSDGGLAPVAWAEPDTPKGCCADLEAGWRCRPECQKWIVNDETALSPDTGYYLAFDVSPATGLPTGCPAFDSAHHWSDDTTAKGYAGPMDCPLQQYAPEGEPLHEVVEEYAEDQDAWLRDFLPALELMLSNGGESLQAAQGHWWGASPAGLPGALVGGQ